MGADNSFELDFDAPILVTILDDGGTDIVQATRATLPVDIDLREGIASGLGLFGLGPGETTQPAVGNFVIAHGTEIENARGGSAADRIAGNALANRLEGGLGADRMTGRSGADTFMGTPAELDGDTIVDLDAEDSVLVVGALLDETDLAVDSARSALLMDIDGDGSHDVRITLASGAEGTYVTTAEGRDTRIAFTPGPLPPADTTLTVGVTDGGSFGNRFAGQSDADGVVRATFTGATVDLQLTFSSFDADFPNEIEVLVNGTSLGYASLAVDNTLTTGETFTIPADLQLEGDNTIAFVQTFDPSWVWGVTDILVEEVTPPEAVPALTLGVVETGSYGNRFDGESDADGEVRATFTGTTRDLQLSFTSFDADFPNEIEVLVNGTSLGFASLAMDNTLRPGETFTIPRGLQVEGENTITFRQTYDPSYVWGVTDILLVEAPLVPEFALTRGVTETGAYGNRFMGQSDADGRVVASFTGGTRALELSLRSFDVDFTDEVEILVNGTSLGFATTSVDSTLNAGDTFTIPAWLQLAGENIVVFEQTYEPSFMWGVTEVLLTELPADASDLDLALSVIESGGFGNRFMGLTEADGEVVATFTGTTRDLRLSFRGFDIDFADEMEVLVNGTSLGFASVGVDSTLNAGDSFTIPSELQVEGDNAIVFRQTYAPSFMWGATDVLLIEQPPQSTDLALSLGVLETGAFGNRFMGQSDADGEVTASFTKAPGDLQLSVRSFDVDFTDEVEILLNGASLGFARRSVDSQLNAGDTFLVPHEMQIEGQNTITFRQTYLPSYMWGVTDIVLEPAATETVALRLGDVVDDGSATIMVPLGSTTAPESATGIGEMDLVARADDPLRTLLQEDLVAGVA